MHENLQMQHLEICFSTNEVFAFLKWPVPIYMRVGYVSDSRFSE